MEMEHHDNPDFDHTPWGRDEHFERGSMADMLEKWEEGVKEAHFIMERINFPPGNKVLDLGCGVGRHAISFARAGGRVTGLDISSLLIARAQEIGRSKNLSVDFVCSDFRNILYENQFDVALLLGDTFGIFNDDDNERFLSMVCNTLNKDGVVVIECINREYIVERMAFQKGIGRIWKENDGVLSSKVSCFDLVRSRYNVWSESMLLKTGEKVVEPVYSLRLYTLCEMLHLLRKSGIFPHCVTGGYDGSDYMASSERMLVIAGRQKPVL